MSEERRFTSQKELARAKRVHTISVSPAPEQRRSVSLQRVEHPCERGDAGADMREWKFSPQQEFSRTSGQERAMSMERRRSSGFVSFAELRQGKRLGSVSIPEVPLAMRRPSDQDPSRPRYDSITEFNKMKKYHSTPIYPAGSEASPTFHSHSPPATPTSLPPPAAEQPSPASSLPPPPPSGDEWSCWSPLGRDSHEKLMMEKRSHLREFPSPQPAPKPEKGELYMSQKQLVSSKHHPGGTQLASPMRAAARSKSCDTGGRMVSVEALNHNKMLCLTPIEKKGFARKESVPPVRGVAAGATVSRTPAVIFEKDGAKYPRDTAEVPKHERSPEYKHMSHSTLHVEKQTTSTPLYPLRSPSHRSSPNQPTASHTTFASEKRRHTRTISSSPARSTVRKVLPSPTTPLSTSRSGSPSVGAITPPVYVGIRR